MRVQLGDFDDGATRQSMRDECDINLIMAKFRKTGAVTHFARHAGRYDFADGVTFHEAMNVVTEGDRMFADLPAELRERFVDPGAFLDFVQDEDNAEEMIEMGLRDPVTARETQAVAERPARDAEVEAAPAASEASVDAANASD